MKLIFIVVIAALFTGGVLTIRESLTDGLILFGTVIFYAFLFHAIMPRRYQVWSDRLRIVLGKPFSFRIMLATVSEVRDASGVKALFYSGIRWATSVRSVVEVRRRKGLNVVIVGKVNVGNRLYLTPC